MEQVGNFMTQFATKEVFTVLAAIATAWIGWKTAGKVGGYAKAFYQKANFRRLAATALLFTGATGIGLGVGEWQCRDTDTAPAEEKQIGLSNDDLVALLEKAKSYDNEECIASILEYTKDRDNVGNIGMSNDELVQLLEDSKYKDENLGPLFEYAIARDKLLKGKSDQQPIVINISDKSSLIPTSYREDAPFEITAVPDEKAINEESIMSTPVAWLSFMLGAASLIASFVLYADSSETAKPKHYV